MANSIYYDLTFIFWDQFTAIIINSDNDKNTKKWFFITC